MPAAPGSMKVLKWDTNLEAVAQAWADGCPENHNGNRGSQYDARGGFTSSVGTCEKKTTAVGSLL